MGMRSNRSIRSLVLAAAAFAAGPAFLVPGALAGFSPEPQVAATAQATIQRAAQLLADDKPVHARALLLAIMDGNGVTLSSEESDHAYRLLTSASRQIRLLPPTTLSLEKADYALTQGDLVNACSHVDAVLATDNLDPADLVRAESLAQAIDDRRSELAPLAAFRLSRAQAAFDNGDLAAAKADLLWVARSDVQLTPEQRAILDTCQMRIVEVEIAQGTRLDTVSLSAMPAQPGVIRRNTDPDPSNPAQPPSADQPAGDQPVDDVIADANRREAQRLFEAAMTAKAERRYSDALSTIATLERDYRSALTAEQLQSLARERNEITILQREALGPGQPILEETGQRMELRRQETRAEFDNLMSQARAMMQAGDFAGAEAAVAEAGLRIRSARDIFAESEVQERLRAAETLRAQIDSAEESARVAEQQRRDAEQAAAARQAAIDAELTRRRQINEAIGRVRDLQASQKYREALQIVDEQILFLEPNNPAGLLLRDVLHDNMLFIEYQRARKQKFSNYADLRVENMVASIPPLDIINFPSDWPSVSFQRTAGAAYTESPENRAVLAKLNDQRVPQVDFPGSTLEQALAYVGHLTQINMDVKWSELEGINIARDQTINLSLKNVPVRIVLERILDQVSEDDFGDRAAWAVNDGVLIVSSDADIRKHTVLDIYDVRDLIVEVPNYDNAPEFDLNTILQSSRGGGGQSPFTENDEDIVRVPFEERMDEMKDMLMDLVDPEGWQDKGGDTGRIYDWNGQLVIVNTPANHREIRGLLSQLRAVRAMQINVETRFLLVSQDFFEQIGFDLDVYFNANNNQVEAARGTDPTILPSDLFDQTGRLRRNVTGGFPPTGGTTSTSQGLIPPNNTSVVGTIQDSLGLAGILMPTEGIASTILSRAPALGVSGQFLDDVQVDFLVQATQADRRSVQLTAPRLTFTNGQTSNIYVVRQVGFVSDLQPIVSDSAVGFDPEIEVVSSGVRMLVDGIVSADRRYVTMNIDAAIAEIEDLEDQPVTAVAGGQLVSSADTQSFIQVPTVTVTRVQTTVTVPDQGTILLGGQRLVSEVEVETGVPVLSKVPVLNRFFTNRIMAKEEQTLLILLKPTVLIQQEQEERHFPGLLESLGGLGG